MEWRAGKGDGGVVVVVMCAWGVMFGDGEEMASVVLRHHLPDSGMYWTKMIFARLEIVFCLLSTALHRKPPQPALSGYFASSALNMSILKSGGRGLVSCGVEEPRCGSACKAEDPSAKDERRGGATNIGAASPSSGRGIPAFAEPVGAFLRAARHQLEGLSIGAVDSKHVAAGALVAQDRLPLLRNLFRKVWPVLSLAAAYAVRRSRSTIQYAAQGRE